MASFGRLLCLSSVAVVLGARVPATDPHPAEDVAQKEETEVVEIEEPEEQDVVQHVESYGVPKLEVLYTSNDTKAGAFLSEWSAVSDFGLFLQLVPDNRGFFPRRVGLIGIARGTKVLLFNLKPLMRKDPRPLPRHMAEFLSNEDRTFYGMGLRDPAAHLAFECDTIVQCVDYKVRTWRQMRIDGGLFRLANLYFGTHWTRTPSVRQLKGQAVYSYLNWAVAEYFMTFYGEPSAQWRLTEAELFAYGPRHIRVENPKLDWEKAREEWVQRKDVLSEERLEKAKETQWYLDPKDSTLQDRAEAGAAGTPSGGR